MIFEKLEREEKEAEKLMFNTEEEIEQGGEPEVEVKSEPIVVEDVTPHQEDWKKRFTNFKATADNTIFQLRRDNASLKNDIATLSERNEVVLSELVELKKQISKQKKEDSFNDLFSKEDEDLLGPEAINVFKKAVKKVVPSEDSDELKGIKEELKQLKQDKVREYKKNQEALETESFDRLKSNLNSLVSDWEDIDTDPQFLKYLEEIDELEGMTKKELFASAVQSRKAKLVAPFYLEYKAQKSPNKEEILKKHITPVGTKGGSVNMDNDNKKETYSISEYTRFMDDVSKGLYRGKDKEAKQKEMIFDKAFMEGRIIG